MATQRYTVTPHPIETILTWVKSGEIAIPEIQRPFVWSAVKVRDLLDSLLQGFPVGYLIAWRNPTVRLKNGKSAEGKRILIDGQQRVTALMAALLGQKVVTQDYANVRIQIAFQPQEGRLEVFNPAIRKDVTWIPDIAVLFSSGTSLFNVVKEYCKKNPGVSDDVIFKSLEKLRAITGNHVGVIELAPDLDIETVTEIFIRVNSAGTELSQADFAMSKIASNDTYGGNLLRKAIDYFCHLAVAPEAFETIKAADAEFRATEFFKKMTWLKDERDEIYDPSYRDMLRVAFTSEFKRGRLQDLVALLSGRNFETRQHEEAIVEDSFKRLQESILRFMNETNFKRFVMIIRSAGFVHPSLIGSQNALNFAYILFLTLRAQSMPAAAIEKAVRRWFVMSILTGRYSASPETAFDGDMRQMDSQGFEKYGETTIETALPATFWTALLPQTMDTSGANSPHFHVYKAAQVKMQDKGFLSRDITVNDLILLKCDEHHIFPRAYLKNQGMSKGRYNQIANYALAQSEINIAIGKRPPSEYFSKVMEQCKGGKVKYGGITDAGELRKNLESHCIPRAVENMGWEDYDEFLEQRRKLMAEKMREYFLAL